MTKTLKQIHEELKNGTTTVEALLAQSQTVIKEKEGDVHALLGMYSDALIAAQVAKAKEMFAAGTKDWPTIYGPLVYVGL